MRAPAPAAPAPATPAARLAAIETGAQAPAAPAPPAPVTNDALAMEQPRSLSDGSAMRKVDQPNAAPALAAASDLPVNGTFSSEGVGGGRGGRGGRGGGGGGGFGGGIVRMAAPTSDSQFASVLPAASGQNRAAGQFQSPSSILHPPSATANSPSSLSFVQHMVRTDEPILANYVATGSVILTSFQIERAGEQVRIVDADGSVYEGTVVNAETPNPAQAGEPAEQRVAMQNQIAPQEAAKAASQAERRAAQDAGVLVGGPTKAQANALSAVPAQLNRASPPARTPQNRPRRNRPAAGAASPFKSLV